MMTALLRSAAPPERWRAIVSTPFQQSGFGQAMGTMGYRPIYLSSGERGALALLRGGSPGLRRVTGRANVFVGDVGPEFVGSVLESLRRWGIPYVKVGDTMSGVRWGRLPGDWPFPRTRLVPRHTFTLDLGRSEQALLGSMEGAERKIRKAEREGVVVRPVETPEHLQAFCGLSRQTSERVRSRTAYTDFPDAFFETLHRHLAPSGVARFYVAWFEEEPVAGCLFLCSPDTMLYYLGGSTRDRLLTAKQAPAAVFWHAIREAKALGLSRFDLGGCTPTDDASDPRYGVYAFKKRWGGHLEEFYNLEVVLSPVSFYLQERMLAPLWDRIHPLYFRLMNLPKARP